MYYADLYAGDGVCCCNEAPLKQWSPPFFNHMKQSKIEGLDLHCFFNDKENMEKLVPHLQKYKNFVRGEYSEDANLIYPSILQNIPPKEWSIFVLDPYKHYHLSFSTIKGISNHASYDSISNSVRKPELIITFMTYTIQQNLKTLGRENVNPEIKERMMRAIDDSLGTPAWRDRILGKQKEEREEKVHIILREIFLNQLSTLGYDSVYFHINQTLNNGPVYSLVFASSIPKASKILSEKFEPYINKIKKEKWVKENFEFYKMAQARNQKIKLLDDYL